MTWVWLIILFESIGGFNMKCGVKRRGETKATHLVGCRLNDEEISIFNKVLEKTGLSKSGFIRKAILNKGKRL